MRVYDLVVIGAGPAGISCAFEAKRLGFDVLLLEKANIHCATLDRYYKDGKRVDKIYKKINVELKGNIDFVDGTKESTMELFRDVLSCIDTVFNSEVDSVTGKHGSFIVRTVNNEVYNARNVAISIGKMGQPNKPSYPLPVKARKKINFSANECIDGENVLVIGGGNSAVEYAVALGATCKVTLNYRRETFTRINEENDKGLRESLQKGLIQPKFGVDINSLEEVDGKIKVNFTDEMSLLFDRLIYAIGGVAPVDFLKKIGIAVDSDGIPPMEPMKGLFVAGDLLFKNGGSIAIALNHGYDIAHSIKKDLN